MLKLGAQATGVLDQEWTAMNEQRKKQYLAGVAAVKLPDTLLAAVKSNDWVLAGDKWVSEVSAYAVILFQKVFT